MHDLNAVASGGLNPLRSYADSMRAITDLVPEMAKQQKVAMKEMRQRGIDVMSQEAQVVCAQALAIAETSVAIQKQQNYDALARIGEGVLDRLGDALTGQLVKWKDVINDMLRQ